MIPLLTLVVLAAGGYGVSLRVNPWKRCWHCKGKGSFPGSVWTLTHHDCWACKGRKRYPRWGVRVFTPARARRIVDRGTDRRR